MESMMTMVVVQVEHIQYQYKLWTIRLVLDFALVSIIKLNIISIVTFVRSVGRYGLVVQGLRTGKQTFLPCKDNLFNDSFFLARLVKSAKISGIENNICVCVTYLKNLTHRVSRLK